MRNMSENEYAIKIVHILIIDPALNPTCYVIFAFAIAPIIDPSPYTTRHIIDF
jgi:hypothetical protein